MAARKVKTNENVAAARAWLEEMPAIHIKHLATMTNRLEDVEEEYSAQLVKLQDELSKERERATKEIEKLSKQRDNLAEVVRQQGARLAMVSAKASEPLSDGLAPDARRSFQ